MKGSGIGGQAVIEGIMMRNGEDYAVAVRKPDGEIEIKKDKYTGVVKSDFLKKTPFIRGVFNFIDSMALGMKTLTFSASFYEEEEDKEKLTDKEKAKAEKRDNILMGFTMVLSIALAIGLFTLLPLFLASFLRKITDSDLIIAIAEGVLRLAIFIGYMVVIAFMEDIRRVYMYHGAEHKCINCIENGLDLTVENVRKSSREHKRCGTSFLLYVVVISIILFFFIRVDSPLQRVVIRLCLIPVIAGISYEIIKLAGRSNSCIMGIVSRPGMWLQGLTTREPDDSMIEVAIKAVETVFDWRSFKEENFKGEEIHDL
ncbi:MAG: DUF1385 domain-containing protein [Clostridiales bacterium]|nr:DUF1385 domain-containing protein [Clostridiales bacterium]